MRFAVCNEFFGSMEFARAAALTAKYGFDGIELAPFTLFGDFSPAAREAGVAAAKKGLADNGLAYAGMHWLFVKPDGLHVTSSDPVVRFGSWKHLGTLLDASGELGGGSLIFGSPNQRASRGIPHDEAMRHYLDGLASVGERAVANSSQVLIEALSASDTDIVNSLAEAEAAVKAVGSPGVSSMFDFHNTKDETEPWDRLVERYWDIIRHVHLNTMEGGWPDASAKGYEKTFAILKEKGYSGWVSLEIFSIPDDPEKVLAETRDFLRRMEVMR